MKKINSIILIITVFLVFGNTVFNGYNLDDELVTKNNPLTSKEKKASFTELFTSPYHESGGISYGYRPITILSFWIEHRLFSESPFVSHVVNLILYGLLILLIYTLLQKLFKNTNPYILLFVSLLFALHPVHSETVASIKNRDEILSLLFFTSAAILSLSWISKRNMLLIIGTTLLISFSILSKKSILPIIFFFPLVFYYIEKLSIRSFILLSACFSLPLALFAFDFNWMHGLLCIACFYCIHLGVYLLLQHIKQAQFNVTFLEIICSITSLFCFAVAIFYQELTLYSVGLLLLLFLSKNYFQIAIILSLSFSLLGYFVFDKEFFAWFYIILSSLKVYLDRDGNLKFQPKFLWLILPFVAVLAYEKSDWLNLIIYLIPLLMFGSVFVNRFIPIIWSLLPVCIGVYFSAFNFFQVGLMVASLLLIKQISYQKFKKVFLVLGVFLFCLFIVIDKYDQNQSFFNKRELLSQKDEDLSENSTSLKEGRKLEFFENTLVAPHSLNERLATGIIVLNEYLRLMIFPKELSFYYGFSKINTTNFSNYWVWIGFVAHALLLFVGIYYAKKQPLITIGALWYVASIFIFSNHTILIAGMVGERLAFVASLGFCIFLGGLVQQVRPNFNFKRPRLAEILALLILVVFSARTIARNALWESHETLMTNDIEHLGNSAQANYLLAINTIKSNLQSHDQGEVFNNKVEFAIKHFNKAISIYPEVYNYHADLARAYIVIENYPEAKNSLIQANRLEPRDLFSLEEIIKISFELKEYADAVKYGELYIEEDERKPLVHELLAYSYYFNNQPAQAFRSAQNGLYYFPQNENLLSLVRNLSPQE